MATVVQAALSPKSGNSATFGVNDTAGNSIAVIMGFSVLPASVTVTDTEGNTYTQAYVPTGSNDIAVFIATNIVGGTANQVTAAPVSGNNTGVAIAEISATLTITNDGYAQASGTGTALSSGNITTTNSNDLILAWFATVQTSGTPVISVGSGWSNFLTNNPAHLMPGEAYEDQIATTTVTVAGTATSTVSINWIATVIALKLSIPAVSTLEGISSVQGISTIQF